jgi:hypothetical protein
VSYYPYSKDAHKQYPWDYDHLGLNSRTHVYCEVNQLADGLAKYGLSLDTSLKIFELSPIFILNILLADAACIVFSKIF